MCHDLLSMEGNKYVHEVKLLSLEFYILLFILSYLDMLLMVFHIQVPNKSGGPPEKKEVLLEDHDPVWLELRHAHIADVCTMFKL